MYFLSVYPLINTGIAGLISQDKILMKNSKYLQLRTAIYHVQNMFILRMSFFYEGEDKTNSQIEVRIFYFYLQNSINHKQEKLKC